MKIALLQMCSDIDVDNNIEFIEHYLRNFLHNDCKMVFLPEYSGLCDQDYPRAILSIVPEEKSKYVRSMRTLARELKIWLHIGSVPVFDEISGKSVNRSLIIDEFGCIIARYDKIHLFDAELDDSESWSESSIYSAGKDAVLVETPLGSMGLAICYDLRFSALFSSLTNAGATVLATPSAFTVPTGRAHWETLLKARAIEFGCFVIAAAQVGSHADRRKTYGHSLVIDPWGDVLLDLGEKVGIGTVDLDLDLVQRVRKKVPALANRADFRGPERF